MIKRKFCFNALSIEDTKFYKGIAILIILFHNFFNVIPPGFGTNEVDFSINRVEYFLNIVINKPENIIHVILSFFGHYGVQIFIFLSAYGLAKKYQNTTKIEYFPYLKHRVFKLYPAFLMSVVFLYIYLALIYKGLPNVIKIFQDTWQSLIYKLTFTGNFIPGELVTVNGPWWFLSLIIQFYIVFPFIIKFYNKFGVYFLIIISLFGLVSLCCLQPYVNIYIAATILAHLPVISLGIYMAKNKICINYMVIIAIFGIFILSNFNQYFWYFSFFSATIILLILFQLVKKYINNGINIFILFVGNISMYIFLIHGYMREPWITNAKNYNIWYMNILLSLIYASIVILFSYYLFVLDKKVHKNK